MFDATPPLAAGGELRLQQRSLRSVLRSSADWRDVTPEQDAFLQQHTIQTEHRRKKTWNRRGKIVWFVVFVFFYFIKTIFAFEFRRFHLG